jgi:hypothetical protein
MRGMPRLYHRKHNKLGPDGILARHSDKNRLHLYLIFVRSIQRLRGIPAPGSLRLFLCSAVNRKSIRFRRACWRGTRINAY